MLELITEEQILTILESYGATPYGPIKPNEMCFSTVCHGGDSHKLYYYRDSMNFYCYTNCGKMDIFSLVMKLRRCSFTEAIYYVSLKAGLSGRNGFIKDLPASNRDNIAIDRYTILRKSSPKQPSKLPQYEKQILDYFESDVFYSGWIDEGISIETMIKFQILWYEIEKHIVIPHYDDDGNLVGIRRRSLQEKDKHNKYMPEIIEGISYAHPLGLNLYGLHQNKRAIQKYKKAIIFESEKSVLLSHDYFGEDSCAVATCGFNTSNWQRDKLLSLGVEEVILGFDKDFDERDFISSQSNDIEYKKYQRYVERIYSLAYKFTNYCRTYVMWDKDGLLNIKDSPFDRGREVAETLLQTKVEITSQREDD